MANEIVTHPFQATDGRRVRIVRACAEQIPYLETSEGHYIEQAQITGPEILKLAEQGRALWNALKAMVMIEPGSLEVAVDVLRATASTFDHNEPEERLWTPSSIAGEGPGLPRSAADEPPVRHHVDAPIPLVPEVVAAAQRGECVTEQEHLASLDEADFYPEVPRGD